MKNLPSILGLISLSISLIAVSGQASNNECHLYLQNVAAQITAKNLKNIPPTFVLTLKYSGRQFNDEGDVEACRNNNQLAFSRLTIDNTLGIPFYAGLCLDQVCNADALQADTHQALGDIANILSAIQNYLKPKKETDEHNENLKEYRQWLIAFNFIQNPQQLAAVQVTNTYFVAYNFWTQSTVNAAFIIAVMVIGLVILCAIVTPIMKAMAQKKKPKKAANQEHLINSSQTNSAYTSSIPPGSTSQTTQFTQSVSLTGAGNNIMGGPTISSVGSAISQVEGKKRRIPLWIKIVQCWNSVENAKKMITLKSNNDDLLIFNGIRTLVFIQVIFGHEFYLNMNYMSNPQDLMFEQKKPFLLFLFACLYSVDVFFYLGGFFLAYVVADEKQARNFSFKKPLKVLISFTFAVINRLFRILPCYFVALMFYWKILPYLGSSPTWDVLTSQTSNCDERWWQNLLFIDNLFDGQKEKCFGWGWYLSNDFQMFIVGMILLIAYQNNRLIGKISIILCFIAFQTVSITLSYKWNFRIPMNVVNLGVPHYYDGYYTKPWCRSPPYFIGLFLGVLYKEHQADKLKKTKKSILTVVQKLFGQSYFKWVSYSIAATIIFFLMFGPHPLQVYGLDYYPESLQNFWFGSCRTFYVIGITFVVLPGVLGSQDLIVQVLNCKAFAFLQRLSFGGYLTHYMIILYTIYQFKDAVFYNCENLIYLFFTNFSFTLIASVVMALIIELPIMNLSGILLGGRKPSSTAPHQTLERMKLEDLKDPLNKSSNSQDGSSIYSKSETVQNNKLV